MITFQYPDREALRRRLGRPLRYEADDDVVLESDGLVEGITLDGQLAKVEIQSSLIRFVA